MADRFVNVNGVQVHKGYLWVIDSGGPFLGPQVAGSAKLVQIDPQTDKIVRVYPFGPDLIPANGYLNDVRFDPDGWTVYLAESGSGALYVLDLESGKARRLLAGSKPTLWTEGVIAKVEGRELRTPDGGVVKIHADQIEISPDGQALYFQALSGPLYKISTAALKGLASMMRPCWPRWRKPSIRHHSAGCLRTSRDASSCRNSRRMR